MQGFCEGRTVLTLRYSLSDRRAAGKLAALLSPHQPKQAGQSEGIGIEAYHRITALPLHSIASTYNRSLSSGLESSIVETLNQSSLNLFSISAIN